jgi:hypothetical protein
MLKNSVDFSTNKQPQHSPGACGSINKNNTTVNGLLRVFFEKSTADFLELKFSFVVNKPLAMSYCFLSSRKMLLILRKKNKKVEKRNISLKDTLAGKLKNRKIDLDKCVAYNKQTRYYFGM